MKRFLITLILLAGAAPLYAAADEGGDGAMIPDYQELVHEGYGPNHYERDVIYRHYATVQPKPTQAYYAKGYTIYYGYTPVPVPRGQANSVYAFGYPVEYFRKQMPQSIDSTNLNHYAALVHNYQLAPGDYIAQAPAHRHEAVTNVQAVATKTTTTTTTAATAGVKAAPLPPIAEKLSH